MIDSVYRAVERHPNDLLFATSAADIRRAKQQGKVAAIGVHIARWVTTHGFALNVNTDLTYFDLIVACEGEPVTSMKRLLGRKLDMTLIEDCIVGHFGEVFEMTPDDVRHNRRRRSN